MASHDLVLGGYVCKTSDMEGGSFGILFSIYYWSYKTNHANATTLIAKSDKVLVAKGSPATWRWWSVNICSSPKHVFATKSICAPEHFSWKQNMRKTIDCHMHACYNMCIARESAWLVCLIIVLLQGVYFVSGCCSAR